MKIHKTAIVSKKAKLGKNVKIGPWCVIEAGVAIGDNTKIWQNVYIAGGTVMGKDNVIHMGAALGHEPQHLLYKKEKTGLVIGDRNIIREYVTIHRAFVPGENTRIGKDNYIMGLAHVGHDCRIANGLIMCNGVLLAGHVTVEDNVFIGGGAAAHQFVTIGTMAMIGGLTKVNQDVLPYTLIEGNAEVRGLNVVGIRRSDLSEKAKAQIKEIYRIIYRLGLNTTNALKEVKKIPNLTKEALYMIRFIEKSKRGLCKSQAIKYVKS